MRVDNCSILVVLNGRVRIAVWDKDPVIAIIKRQGSNWKVIKFIPVEFDKQMDKIVELIKEYV